MSIALKATQALVRLFVCTTTNSVLLFFCIYGSLQAGDGVSASSFAAFRSTGLSRSAYRSGQQQKTSVHEARSRLAAYKSEIFPVLQQKCVACHGPDTQEGNVRIDTLNPDLLHGDDIDWWLEIQSVLTNGEMPPPDEVSLPDKERSMLIDWLSNEIHVASIKRRASAQHSSFRRMTRYEFKYALQDLLGLPYDFARDLPPEPASKDGFQNSSDVLHMTSSQLETYHQLARQALRRAVVQGDRPPVLHWGIPMRQVARHDWAKQNEQWEKVKAETADNPEEQKRRLAELEIQAKKPHPVPWFLDLKTGKTVRAGWQYYNARYANLPAAERPEMPDTTDCVAILPRGRNRRFTIELGDRLPDHGTMRVRVRACRADETDDKGIPTLQLLFGWQASNEGRALMPVPDSERRIDALPGQPKVYEWNVPLGEIYPRNSVRGVSRMGQMPSPSEYIRLANSSVSQGAIQVDYVEVSAPVYEQWPPESHRRIFAERADREDEQAYARRIIAAFMRKAWRAPLTDEALQQKMRLFTAVRAASDSFEDAVVEVLATVLASPRFLYIAGDNGDQHALSPHQLATRLSLFLWCSLPDAELLNLADDNRIADPDVLGQQVQRMLNDPRSKRLSEHFVSQWLDLQLLDFRSVPKQLEDLKQDMRREPVEMFHEMLKTNASVLDFLHADYTVINERLAEHYGIANVRGNEFRRISLRPEYRRGGLLTQAGLLAMNSAGEDSHPLKRGVWLLESLLNDPPPPPPPAVPEIDLADPRVAQMTLKERIEDHRNHAACMSCHAKIDPWGIAFENYDALGRWRTHANGKAVDAVSELFNKQKLDGMDGLKRFLLENRQDQFVRAIVCKLTTFALGRPLSFADRAAIEEITSSVRQHDDGLATVITAIAVSELFRSP